MNTTQRRIEEAADKVTEVLLRLALDVAAVGGSVEDVRQLADTIGAAFRRAAPTTQDMFNNLADDLEGVNRDNSSSSNNSSEDEGPPPPKRQELDNRARFLEHNLLTGYSHPEDSTIPASEDSDDSDIYLTPYSGDCSCCAKH